MDPDESVQFFRRYAPAVLNAVLATGCTLLALVLYGTLGTIDGGDTGTAIALLAVAMLAVGGFAVAIWLFAIAYYYLARYRFTGPHVALDVGTASTLAFLPALALLVSSREAGLLACGLALCGEVVGILTAVLYR